MITMITMIDSDSQCHLPGDVPERININNLTHSAQLLLCAILEHSSGD
ncbi:MAG: hypothetical protein ACUVR3_13870 [Candidatus Roseilinea sp.]